MPEGYLGAPYDVPMRPCGATPSPRHKLAGATPHLIEGATPDQWCWIPHLLSYWLNNKYGCCVTAEEAFARACSGILISDNVVGSWAQQHRVLNGAVISDVLDWMATAGFHQDGNSYGAGGKASIDYHDALALQNAISKGPVKIGVAAAQLQSAVGTRNGWFGVGFRPDSDYDHCVSLCGYGTTSWLAQQLNVTVPAGVDGGAPGYLLFTWDTIGVIDVPSMLAITCEAWLRNPTTVTTGSNPPTPDPVFTPQPPVPPTPIPPVPPTPPGSAWNYALAIDRATGAPTITARF